MGQSPSAFQNWPDRDFFQLGAFMVMPDGESFIFAKGGSFTQTDKIKETKNPVFYLKDFFANSYLAYTPSSFITLSKANILAWLNSLSVAHTPLGPIGNDDDLYQKDFNLLKSALGKDLEKVVLISRETYEAFEGEITIKKLIRSAIEMGTGYPFGFWKSDYGVIGSTPELLYHIDANKLHTFALAGTAAADQEAELINSKKDRHEHDLVIRDIVEKLKNFVTQIHVHETKIIKFKNIAHLKTDIEADIMEGIDYSDLTSTLSPTAALGGYPKGSALSFLKGSHYADKYPIRYFGSAFGIMTEQYKTFIVSIRNVQWENNHLFIESGGGIVAESDFNKELEEIHLKRNIIRKNYL
jgi:isochorismate synthase EntC